MFPRAIPALLTICCALPLVLLAEPVRLAERGSQLQPVVIAEHASAETKQAAERLAGMLERITTAKFPVQSGGDGTTGIAVGLVDDFPALESDVAGREEYVLHSHAHGLHVIGAKMAGLEHDGWDLLYLG